MFNSFGNIFKFTSFGESHGSMIGGVIDGIIPNMVIDKQRINDAINYRKPGKKLTSTRKEDDEVNFISGLFEEDDKYITTGTPIAFFIKNIDKKSKDYDLQSTVFRPGHGEFTYGEKYGIFDEKGGGRASARETAIRVIVGSIALQILEQLLNPKPKIEASLIAIGSHFMDERFLCESEIWPEPLNSPYKEDNYIFCPDSEIKKKWEDYLKSIRKEQDSVGALVAVRIKNFPAGIGSPIYQKLSANLANAMIGINASKSVEFGIGKDSHKMRGSQYNDPMRVDENNNIYFKSNNHGGIIAGISSSSIISLKVAFKPTASISREIESVNIKGENAISFVKGRHDPCIGIRAVIVVTAMAAICLLDAYQMHKSQIIES